MIIGLIAIFLIIILIDIPNFKKTKHKAKTIIPYFFLILLGFVLSLLQVMDKPPMRLHTIIEKIIYFFIPGG